MLRLVSYTFITVLFMSFTLQVNRDKIEWSSNRKLRFEDFKSNNFPEGNYIGKFPKSLAHAVSSIIYEINFIGWDNKYPYDIRVYFEKDNSWMPKADSLVLFHEQIHYDISEITARRIRKLQIEYFALDDISLKEYERKVDVIFKDGEKMQTDFDLETLNDSYDYGYKDYEYWRKKTDRQLDSLSSYEIYIN